LTDRSIGASRDFGLAQRPDHHICQSWAKRSRQGSAFFRSAPGVVETITLALGQKCLFWIRARGLLNGQAVILKALDRGGVRASPSLATKLSSKFCAQQCFVEPKLSESSKLNERGFPPILNLQGRHLGRVAR